MTNNDYIYFMLWHNEFTRLLQVQYPIIQAPMLGITSPAMVAAIAEEGGLGSLPVGGLPPDLTATLIRKVKALTGKPFAVNIFAFDLPSFPSENEMENMRLLLEETGRDQGMKIEIPTPDPAAIYSYKDQIDIFIEENIPVISFTFGIPSDDIILRCKERGILLIGTATCLQEGILLAEKGIDCIVAQGAEAGGHRGSFGSHHTLPLIGSFALIPELVDSLHLPVIAAGAIADGRAIRAALMLGASAVQAGSVFMQSDESLAAPYVKDALQDARDTDTVLTRALTGRWARGLRNKLIGTIERSGLDIPAYPFQNMLVTPMRMRAQEQSDTALSVMWAGQAANRAQQKAAAVIFRELIEQVETL